MIILVAKSSQVTVPAFSPAILLVAANRDRTHLELSTSSNLSVGGADLSALNGFRKGDGAGHSLAIELTGAAATAAIYAINTDGGGSSGTALILEVVADCGT